MEGEKIWKVKYKGHPKTHLEWHDQYDKKIICNDKYSVSVTDDTVTLKIRNLTIRDAGNYTLKAHNDLVLVPIAKSFTLKVAGLL